MLSGIYMRNIQSIPEVSIPLPKTGIVRFLGRNGNGKSIFVKVIKECASGGIGSLKTRKSLISKWATDGELVLTRYDGMTLKIYLNIEASRTYVELFDPATNQKYRRYLSDGKNVLLELTDHFGIHYDEKRDISLNIYETFGGILFVSTPPPMNFDIISLATSDWHAEHAKENLEFYIQDQTKKLEEVTVKVVDLQRKLEILNFYDVESEKDTAEICEQLINLITNLRAPSVVELTTLPDISFIEVEIPQVQKLHILPDLSMIEIEKEIPSPTELSSAIDAGVISAIDVMSHIPVTQELDKQVSIIAELEMAKIAGEIATNIKDAILTEKIASVIECISKIDSTPSPQRLSFSLETTNSLVSIISTVDTAPIAQDIASDLVNLNEMRAALETMSCPLCGSKLLTDKCGGEVVC